MGVFDYFKKDVELETHRLKSFIVDIAGQTTVFDALVGSSPGVMLDYYTSSPAVSIPVNMIVDPFSVMEPVLQDCVTGDIEREGPVIDLMRDPSPHWSREGFQQKLGIESLVTGMCYPVAIGATNGPPTEINSITPISVTPIQGESGWAESYLVGDLFMAGHYLADTSSKRQIRYLKDGVTELIPIERYSTLANSLIGGQSVLESVIDQVQQNISGGQHNLQLLQNGGRISLVFNYEQELSDDDLLDLQKKIDAKFTVRKGQIAVTAGSKVDIKEMGSKNIDMDFRNLQQDSKTDVAMNYNIPLPLLTVDAATLNNYQQAWLALYDQCVIPLSKHVYGGISDAILPRFGIDPTKKRITYDPDKVVALVQRKLEQTLLMVESNLYKHDEMRKLAGLPPLEGGVGDVVYQNSSMLPLGSQVEKSGASNQDDATPGRVVVPEDGS